MRNVLLRAPGPAAIWILILLALALRLVVVALTTGAGYDMMSYSLQAESVLTHHNVYTFTDRYPYPPVWVWLVAVADWMANTTGLPFDELVRIPGIVGDTLIVALLQRYKGSKAALFYAVNPVPILITAGHGQFDGLVMALVVGAWVLWDTRLRRAIAWTALALGGAIALKGYPVLLLPALLSGVASAQQRAALTGLVFIPLLACVLVYSAFFGLEPTMISRVLGYQSPSILGWSLYLDKLLPQLAFLLGGPTRLAVLLFPVLLARGKPAWSLESLWLATMLGFYVLAPGLSPQYVLWAVPLLAAADLKKGLLYTAFAAPMLVCVYLWGFPEAIPWGPALISIAPPSVWKPGYWATNLVWWLVCIWLVYSMFPKGKRAPAWGESPQARRASQDASASHRSCAGLGFSRTA